MALLRITLRSGLGSRVELMITLMPVLNFRLSQRRMSVSSRERVRCWRLINQEKGEIRRRELRGSKDEAELRDWERRIIWMRETLKAVAG